ncbi:MAG: C40 family peptidase [Polaribacter sp.]|uniref:C40 family peptidase n=1 Tax=Polaribacter sp. TaxID=1920175 RepID=UPI003BB066A5
MNRFFLTALFLVLIFSSCSLQKTTLANKKDKNNAIVKDRSLVKPITLNEDIVRVDDKKDSFNSNTLETELIIDKIVTNALSYLNVKYKYGGITEKGMDCSGLVSVAFSKEDIQLPRSSRNIAEIGMDVSLENVKKGDLLFFIIRRNSNTINHVGLIVEVKDDEIFFIHSTTSKGVIVSSLSEAYWTKTFVKAKSIL